MKNIISIVGIGFLSGMIELQAAIPKHSPEFYEAIKPEVREAQRKGANAKIIYRVVDDEGIAVSNVTLYIKWQNDYPRKIWRNKLETDSEGFVTVAERVGGKMSCRFYKEGYYSSFDKIDFHWRKGVSPVVKDDKWQPYGGNRTIVLKRKKKPVEMCWMNSWKIDNYLAPATNIWIGLDMELGKWCYPYGEGKCNDVLIRFTGEVYNCRSWATLMEVSFTNNPYAGFYELPKDMYSDMKTCYFASTNNDAYVFRYYSLSNKVTQAVYPSDSDIAKLPYNKYLVFRTRTRVDSKGRLVSAHYGRICGEWRGGAFSMSFGGNEDGIYFNPIPNDPNLEDMETVNRLKQIGR